MSFLMRGVNSKSFWLLMIAHFPNRYLAMIVLCFYAALQFVNSEKLVVSRVELAFLFGFFGCQAVGLGSSIMHFSSVNNILWSCFNYSLVAGAIILCATLSRFDIRAGLRMFIVVESIVLLFQYFHLAIMLKTIYVFSSFSGAGDFMSGTLLGFSSPMAVSLMLASAYFLFSYLDGDNDRTSLIYAAVAALFSTFPGMMSGVAIFAIAIALTLSIFFIKELGHMNVSKLNMAIIPLILLAFGTMAFFLGENIKYMGNIIALLSALDNPPIKVLVIQKYLEMINLDSYLYFGAGVGNFTSRAAAMVSGQYFESQPFFVPVTPSFEMLRYILPYWNRGMFGEIVGGSIGNSMVNEPFNGNLSMLAECGIIGFSAWILGLSFCLAWAFVRNSRALFFVLIFMLGISFTNDWFAYASFSMTFVVLMKASIMENFGKSNFKHRGACEFER